MAGIRAAHAASTAIGITRRRLHPHAALPMAVLLLRILLSTGMSAPYGISTGHANVRPVEQSRHRLPRQHLSVRKFLGRR